MSILRDTLLRAQNLATKALRVTENGAGHFTPHVSISQVGECGHTLFRYLDTNGDGTGTKSAIGNYSVIPETFFLKPPADKVYRIAWLHIFIEGAGALAVEKYGPSAVLTNGVTITLNLNGVAIDLTDGLPIHSNADFYRFAYDTLTDVSGGANHAIRSRINFMSAGCPLRLNGATDDSLVINLNDDFTGLIDHAFIAKGIVEEDL